jgi:hypothetical protein
MFTEQGGKFKKLRDSQFQAMDLVLADKEVGRRYSHYINTMRIAVWGDIPFLYPYRSYEAPEALADYNGIQRTTLF